MRKLLMGCFVITAALGIASPSASAASSPAGGSVAYQATMTPTSVIIHTDSGSMVADHGVFEIDADDGTTLAGTEMSFRVDDFTFPVVADVHDRTAILTPKFDLAHATYQPVALPYEDGAPWKTEFDREQAAWNRLSSTIIMGATVGTLVGGIAGAGVGCLLGGIAGATVAAATIVGMFGPFIPAAVVGCLGGIVAIGALGTVAGQILITAPVAILAAVQYFTTISAPFRAH